MAVPVYNQPGPGDIESGMPITVNLASSWTYMHEAMAGAATGAPRIVGEAMTDLTAGDNIHAIWADAAVSAGLAKLGETTVYRNGAIRFTLTTTNSAAAVQIYRNGIAVGTPRGGAGTWTEDISGWASGDLLQIYGYEAGLTSIPWSLTIKAAEIPTSVIPSQL